jgi:hypothetical protein
MKIKPPFLLFLYGILASFTIALARFPGILDGCALLHGERPISFL